MAKGSQPLSAAENSMALTSSVVGAALDLLEALIERLADLHIGEGAAGEHHRDAGRRDNGKSAGATHEYK